MSSILNGASGVLDNAPHYSNFHMIFGFGLLLAGAAVIYQIAKACLQPREQKMPKQKIDAPVSIIPNSNLISAPQQLPPAPQQLPPAPQQLRWRRPDDAVSSIQPSADLPKAKQTKSWLDILLLRGGSSGGYHPPAGCR